VLHIHYVQMHANPVVIRTLIKTKQHSFPRTAKIPFKLAEKHEEA